MKNKKVKRAKKSLGVSKSLVILSLFFLIVMVTFYWNHEPIQKEIKVSSERPAVKSNLEGICYGLRAKTIHALIQRYPQLAPSVLEISQAKEDWSISILDESRKNKCTIYVWDKVIISTAYLTNLKEGGTFQHVSKVY